MSIEIILAIVLSIVTAVGAGPTILKKHVKEAVVFTSDLRRSIHRRKLSQLKATRHIIEEEQKIKKLKEPPPQRPRPYTRSTRRRTLQAGTVYAIEKDDPEVRA